MRRRTQCSVALLAAGTAALFALPGQKPIRFNHTPSLPIGLYAVSYHPSRIAAGQFVLVCLPPPVAALARARGYIGRGDCGDGSEPVLKRVAASPGDVVTVSAGGLFVNGAPVPNTRPLRADSAGRLMTIPTYGNHVVARGTYWFVANVDPRSFDSRYFGALSGDAVLAEAHPIITF